MHEAVREAQQGRAQAFELLVERYGASMLRIASGILGPDDGRDAAQEAFVHAWRELPRLRQPDRFEPWLRRIVVNQCRKALRGRRRRPALSLDRPLAVVTEPATTTDFRDAVHAREALDGAFEALSADQRTVVVLHYGAGLSLREAAETMEVAVGTAKSRLNAALSRLRKVVEVQ